MNPGWRWRVLTAGLLLAAVALPAVESIAPPDRGAALFTNRVVRQIQISIPPESIQSLRISPRQYVRAVLQEGTNAAFTVALHLKGSTGSFRSIDGRPGFTISVDRFEPAQRFHGLRKIHLNNSVEDPGCMNELLGGEVFRAAGVPAARVAHATVTFNGRPLGLYVLKEGFTEDFLALYFRHTNGSLYDTGAGHDVDEPLRKDLGPAPEDRSELDALTAAAREPDLTRRWPRLQRALDMDRVLAFMATEILLGHRDGYCLARNNFRIYHDVDTGRLVFFPHGMDVLFGNARALIEPRMNGLVAQSIMETPEGRRAYRAKVRQVFTNHFQVVALHARIDETLACLLPALPTDEAAALTREAAALKERVATRHADVERQLQSPPLELLQFDGNAAPLAGWTPVDIPEGGRLAVTEVDGKRALWIQAGPVTSASWRTKVLLPPGRYRFEASLRTAGLAPLKFGRNHGARLRIAGAPANSTPGLTGDRAWTPVAVTFETTAREQEIDLMCEGRASRGDAWFALDSLRLVREK